MRLQLFCLLAFLGCGAEVDDPPVVGPYQTLVARPDRLTLLGPGDARAIGLFGRTSAGVLEAIPWAEATVSVEPAMVVKDTPRGLWAVGAGHAEVIVRHSGLERSLSVEVLSSSGPFASEVLSRQEGLGAGFGQDRYPQVIFGPPDGGGAHQGSMDVLSLGAGGSITVGFGSLVAFDGPGPDLIIFENPFTVAGGAITFTEPAEVAIANAGVWVTIPCAPQAPYTGCAGLRPVLAGHGHPDIDPTDWARAGGDAFDLEGLSPIADQVSITDTSTVPNGANSSGFDLDALALVHAMPKSASALAFEPSTLRLKVGEAALLPRVDLALTAGGVIAGFSAKPVATVGTVVLEGELLRAVATGTAAVTFTAGLLSSPLFIEVIE